MLHRLVITLVAFLSASVVASPAVADTQKFVDGTATEGPMDINSVTVKNDGKLVVRIAVANLRPRAGSSVKLWIDSRPRKGGSRLRRLQRTVRTRLADRSGAQLAGSGQ